MVVHVGLLVRFGCIKKMKCDKTIKQYRNIRCVFKDKTCRHTPLEYSQNFVPVDLVVISNNRVACVSMIYSVLINRRFDCLQESRVWLVCLRDGKEMKLRIPCNIILRWLNGHDKYRHLKLMMMFCIFGWKTNNVHD